MVSEPKRRSFLRMMAGLPLMRVIQSSAGAAQGRAQFVAAGHDQSDAPVGHGFSRLDYKVSSRSTAGGLFVMEHINLVKGGGPPLHLHHEQEEWFYLLEGEMIVQVGGERTRLQSGDSVLAPRNIPHAYLYVAEKPGRLLIAFTPAGKIEAFFRDVRPHDAKVFREYGMELIGPPMSQD